MPVENDVIIPKVDWRALRGKRLFWVPQINAAHDAMTDSLPQAELAEAGKPTKAYSMAVARSACLGQPMNFNSAYAVATGFNGLKSSQRLGRSAETVVSALLALRERADLFSEEALAGHGVTLPETLGLRSRTMTNLYGGGRLTAHVAKTFLEGVQAAYTAAFADKEAPENVAAFIACTDLRTYVTPDKDAGHQEILKDGAGNYYYGMSDLLPAPAGWTDWTEVLA